MWHAYCICSSHYFLLDTWTSSSARESQSKHWIMHFLFMPMIYCFLFPDWACWFLTRDVLSVGYWDLVWYQTEPICPYRIFRGNISPTTLYKTITYGQNLQSVQSVGTLLAYLHFFLIIQKIRNQPANYNFDTFYLLVLTFFLYLLFEFQMFAMQL